MSPRRFVSLRSFPGFSGVGVCLLLFLYLPLLVVVVYSFNANSIATVWTGFSVRWFEQVFASEPIRQALWNSLTVAAWSTATAVVVAVLAAVGFIGMRRRSSRFALALISAPLILPEIVLAIALLSLFAWVHVPLGIPAMILAHAVVGLPFALLPIHSRLAGADWTQFEAAADLGADEWRIFRRVTLPMLQPAIVSGAMLCFIVSMDNFVMSFFTSGPGSTTLPLYIWGALRVGLTPEINALSSLILIASIAVLVASHLLSRKKA